MVDGWFTWLNLVEEGQGLVCGESAHVAIEHGLELLAQGCQLVKVSCKYGETLYRFDQVPERAIGLTH